MPVVAVSRLWVIVSPVGFSRGGGLEVGTELDARREPSALAGFRTNGGSMLILGLILLLLGFLLKVSILWTIGIVLLIVGAVLWILGSTGRAVGGRRHWF
jgi:hypothetical protein